ncbi:MAG TPA: HAD family hydrolase [Humibacillus xanthopallidus]|nr:HAD family hydrolase [Humibacillus xanthopallidus]
MTSAPATDPRSAIDLRDRDSARVREAGPDPADIRLVVVDLDGTLLDGAGELPGDTVATIRALRERGVDVAPASGRQHATIARLFTEVAEDLVVIAENGAYVTRDGAEVSSHTLDLAWSRGVVEHTRRLGARGVDLGVVLCGKTSAWIERTDDAFLGEVERYYARLTTTDDLTTVEDEVLKLAVHDFGDPTAVTGPDLAAFCAPQQVVVSGHHWVDVMGVGVHKGLAVRELQGALGITAAQTMAFGDYLNDLEMLGAAEHSYAMANAHPEVLEAARHVAPANTDDGVLRTLREVFAL